MPVYFPRPSTGKAPPNHPLAVHAFALLAYFSACYFIDELHVWGIPAAAFVVGGLFTLAYDRWQPCVLWSTAHILAFAFLLTAATWYKDDPLSTDLMITIFVVAVPVCAAASAAGCFGARALARRLK